MSSICIILLKSKIATDTDNTNEVSPLKSTQMVYFYFKYQTLIDN